MSEYIAERKLIGIRPDGQEFAITIRIGKPCDSGDGDWACPVELTGLYDKLGRIYAIDSFHALMLAIQFAKKLLASFMEDGGKLLWVDSREPVELEELFSIGVGTSRQSQEELENQFQETRRRIREIEEKALRKLGKKSVDGAKAQAQTMVMNCLFRFDGVSGKAEAPFEAPLEGQEHDDFHVLDFVEHVPLSIEEFIRISTSLIDSHSAQFERYRNRNAKIFLHVAIQHGVDTPRLPPAFLIKLAQNDIVLEITDYDY